MIIILLEQTVEMRIRLRQNKDIFSWSKQLVFVHLLFSCHFSC